LNGVYLNQVFPHQSDTSCLYLERRSIDQARVDPVGDDDQRHVIHSTSMVRTDSGNGASSIHSSPGDVSDSGAPQPSTTCAGECRFSVELIKKNYLTVVLNVGVPVAKT